MGIELNNKELIRSFGKNFETDRSRYYAAPGGDN
jgi:hypothetical protein